MAFLGMQHPARRHDDPDMRGDGPAAEQPDVEGALAAQRDRTPRLGLGSLKCRGNLLALRDTGIVLGVS